MRRTTGTLAHLKRCLAELLDLWCRHKVLPVKTVVVGCQQLASALAYMHSSAVCAAHLDLHAANVMVTRDGAAWKIIDMGCASHMFDQDGNSVQLDSLRCVPRPSTSALHVLPPGPSSAVMPTKSTMGTMHFMQACIA